MTDVTDFLGKSIQDTMAEPAEQANSAEDFRPDFSVGRAGELTGQVIGTAARLPGQTFSALTPRPRKSIQAGAAASSERSFEARENALDRRSQERIERIKNLSGIGDLKIGSTKERTVNELVTNPRGWAGLSPEKQWILEKGFERT